MDAAHLSLWTEQDGSTHYGVSLGSGERGSAHCSAYPDRTPILSAWRPGVNVTVSPESDTRVTDAELRFARDLAAVTAVYLAECERWHVPDTDSHTETGGGSVDRVA